MRTLYFLKNIKYDVLTTLIALVLLYISSVDPYFSNKKEISNVIQAVIILVSAVVLIYLRVRDKDFYFIPLTSRKDKDDWIGKGAFDYDRNNNCYSISNSEAGYIYSKCLTWSDCRVSFNFKIIKTCIGIIMRAINLSNYIMLQIQEDGIRPHIRINGGWKAWEIAETKMGFRSKISLDKWYKCILVCDKNRIDIKLLDGKVAFFKDSG